MSIVESGTPLASRQQKIKDAIMPMGTAQGRRFAGHAHTFVIATSIGAFAMLNLIGCGGSTPVASTTPTATIPRHATPTATLGTITDAAMLAITPASTNGWAIYHDPRFGFQTPIPPGWQSVSLIWPSQPDPNGFNYYIVQFFPPGSHGEAGPGASSMAPELIEITITLSGPFTNSIAQSSGFSAESRMVALGTKLTRLYDQGSPGNGGEITRAAETTLGSYPMSFKMHYLAYGTWNPSVAQRDFALFLGMMQGYRSA